MKLALLCLEARVDPSIVPALNRLTNKLMKMVETTGVKMVPAKTPLAYEFDWQKHNQIRLAYDDKVKTAKAQGSMLPSEPPEPLKDRWDTRSRGVGGPIWLAGYIKMGPLWASVWITLQGTVLLRKQYKYGNDEHHNVSEHHSRQFNGFKEFIAYLKGDYKTFTDKEPIQRFLDMLNKSWEKGYTVQWREPAKPSGPAGSDLGALDDKDEFSSHQWQMPKHQYGGVMYAATQLRKLVDEEGKTIKSEDISIVLDASDVNNWIEQSGADIDKVDGAKRVQIMPSEIFGSDYSGHHVSEINWPTQLKKTLTDIAHKVSERLVRRVNKPLDKPKQRYLDALNKYPFLQGQAEAE